MQQVRQNHQKEKESVCRKPSKAWQDPLKRIAHKQMIMSFRNPNVIPNIPAGRRERTIRPKIVNICRYMDRDGKQDEWNAQ